MILIQKDLIAQQLLIVYHKLNRVQ